jgi:hypothetical protein
MMDWGYLAHRKFLILFWIVLVIACKKDYEETPIIEIPPTEMATYYVSTTGSDSGAGTITQPWATWQWGFNHILPGDILYIRGGTYTPTVIVTTSSRHCAVVVSGKNGSAGSKYQVFAYPGEVPILDCRNITSSTYERRGILILNSSYWHIKGLSVTRVDQAVNRMGGQGIEVWGISSCTYNTIESCIAYYNGGPGMGTRQYVNEIHFLNCDAYSNFDPYSNNPGGNADGFDVGYSYNDGIVRLTGCRAWWNGDDGFDMYQGTGYRGIYYLTNCWAWHHGYGPAEQAVGDGAGFKLGSGPFIQTDTVTRLYLYNCIAYDNRTWGFSQNMGNSKSALYNCIAYDNVGRGFDFSWNNQYDTLRNCISYANGSSDIFLSNVIHDHNSWDSSPAVTVSSADFTSLLGAQLSNTRQSSGNLPLMTFLHLTATSDLINRGGSTGIYATDGDYNAWDTPPSIGPFEYAAVGAIPVTAVTVTGASGATTISVDNGTLQMAAHVDPHNATVQTVVWSVTNDTGTATISATGLLTAVTNGTVTVKATSNG